jgi:hypothetical protein
MYGGLTSSYTINTAVINLPLHGYGTGFGVSFSTNSGVRLSPLVMHTTYYVIRVDANNIALATSKANAVAGSSITLTSSQTATTADSYSLIVTTAVGSPLLTWQASNDNTYWVALSTRTNSTGVAVDTGDLSSYVLAGTSKLWDFGRLGYRYLRAAVTGPTRGAVWLKIMINGKRYQ